MNNCYGIVRIKEGTTLSPTGRQIPWRETYSTIPGYDSLPPGEYHLIRVEGTPLTQDERKELEDLRFRMAGLEK